jgi:hypothetical protein
MTPDRPPQVCVGPASVEHRLQREPLRVTMGNAIQQAVSLPSRAAHVRRAGRLRPRRPLGRARGDQHGLLDDPKVVVPISVFWLVPQFAIHGVADAFSSMGHEGTDSRTILTVAGSTATTGSSRE